MRSRPGLARVAALVLVSSPLVACSAEQEAPARPAAIRAVTFNTGTSKLLGNEGKLADQYYGNGLAWLPVVEDTRRYLEELDPDVVFFQEIFDSAQCPSIPADARAGFVCEAWQPGDPTVAQIVLGPGFRIACHLGKSDKCVAVKKSFGELLGCSADLCLDALAGAAVPGCGKGSRVGRGVVELGPGGLLTLVNVHGSSGLSQADQDCRAKQFEQVFSDLGTGDGPAANGKRNLIMGDLNTDPGRHADFDESAQTWNEHVGADETFQLLSEAGPDAVPTYGAFANIDHAASDALTGSCWSAGLSPEHPNVTETVSFDHRPLVCTLAPRH